MDKGKHLDDIDCFLELARQIEAELLNLQKRVNDCKNQLNSQMCSLKRDMEEAQWSINDAQQSDKTDTVEYQRKEKNRYNSRLQLLEQDEQALRDGKVKIPQYLSVISEAIRRLEFARKDAELDCNEFRQAIEDAAVCMGNYINTGDSYDSFEGVRHIKPKEG